MADSTSPPPAPADSPADQSSPAAASSLASIAVDLQRTVLLSTDSSSHIRTLKDFLPQVLSQYRTYEDAVVKKVKDKFASAKEHPAASIWVALAAGIFLIRGPRRFLFRHTLGQLQSEEALYARAEKNLKELNLSVDLMSKETKKLLERSTLAEKDMQYGRNELLKAGNQIQHLAKSIYKVEVQTADLMERLRDIPGREALTLRANVASIASILKKQRAVLDKRVMKICELGVPV